MAPRPYSSPTRDAQTEATRDRLFEVARTMLADGGLDALTLPRLARVAGVSVPTVYRHFPTIDDLVRAFLDWIRPRVGQTQDRLLACAADDLPALPLDNFARYEAHAAVLRPLMESRAFNRIRVASMRDRARGGAAVLRGKAPGWSDAELEAAAGAVYLHNSPQVWRWLRETWGLDADEAARASSWAMGVLIAALAERPGLGPGAAPPPSPSTSTPPRKPRKPRKPPARSGAPRRRKR